MMRQGTFRDDLYYRINTILIKASPLREHPDDIADLAKAYWEKKNRKSKLSPKFLDYLKTYSWPGNVRELNALLNSLADYYSDVSPTPQHVEYIRKWRQDELIQAKNIENDDPSRLLKIKSQNVLIEVQNIMRLVKTEFLKEINSQTDTETNKDTTGRLKTNISGLIVKLNKLCLEPGYFIRWELFKLTEKYIQVLDEMQKNWPESRKQLQDVWKEKLQKPDDEINQGIMELVWGKVDK
jgi:transcriptional regulator with PAS, ATPase and Fis domain